MSMRLGSSLVFSTLQTTSEFLLHADQELDARVEEEALMVNPSKMSSALVGALLEVSFGELAETVLVFVVSRTRVDRFSDRRFACSDADSYARYAYF